jgi:AraC family transcriptional regulator
MLAIMNIAAARMDMSADGLERAMAHIRAHAADPLTLEELARVAGLSPYHFTRQFLARFGLSPMAEVRARRLELAAGRLAADAAPPLVELAFDCGFESQEGFTRAFKRAFGVSPGRFRRRQAPPRRKEAWLSMADLAPSLTLIMQPKPQPKPALRVAGFSGLFDETNRHEIPALWPRLIERTPLPGQTGGGLSYGVCIGEPGGGFRYMAAVPIAADAPAPEGMEVREISPQTCLVFRQVLDGSALHPQMQAAAREIWGERLPRCGFTLAQSPDLEVYPADFQPDRAGAWVEWWIPVKA